MSHIKTIDFLNATTSSGKGTSLQIDYESDSDGEKIAIEALVDGVKVDPSSVSATRDKHKDTFTVTLTRSGFQNKTVLVEATIMIDADHGSSAFDSIELV